jgi:two-component system response regulator RegX3
MEWLKSSGHTCDHFAARKQFIRKIKHESYDVLILDWMVPDMDGYEVLRWVRENFDGQCQSYLLLPKTKRTITS